jgi:hypothetical protein
MGFYYYKIGGFIEESPDKHLVEIYGYENKTKLFEALMPFIIEHRLNLVSWVFLYDDDDIFLEGGNVGVFEFSTGAEAAFFKLAKG